MTLHRFEVNVPNPGPKACDVMLRLEAADPTLFAGLERGKRRKPLEIVRAGIERDPCSRRGEEKLKLRLSAFSSVNVFVAVETGGPTPGVAGLNLIDRRGNRDVGGVLMICADPPVTEAAGGPVPARNPCPASLARGMYAVAPGADPASATHLPLVLGKVTEFDLVAPIKNPTKSNLSGTSVYLEHCGPCGASFAPGMWNVGDLAAGGIFYATWRVQLPANSLTPLEPVAVVSSAKTNPVRLNGQLPVKHRPGREVRKPPRG